MTRSRLPLAFAAAALACASPARADVVNGTIIAFFSGIVTSGYIANAPTYGQTTYTRNGSTAVYSINNSTNPAVGSQLSWGDSNNGNQASTLTFSPTTVNAIGEQTFRIGQFVYFNGSSGTNSLIFGASIDFYLNSVSAANYLGSDDLYITTTQNQGDPVRDVDYLNVCGNQSNICDTSIKGTESSQGGTGLTFDFFGRIVGDPQLFIDQVTLANGQSSTINGSLGNDAPVAFVPEPGALLLCGTALALAAARPRRRTPAAPQSA